MTNAELIEKCSNSTEGTELLEQMGEETEKLDPPLGNIPTITFNDKFYSNIEKMAVKDLKTTIEYLAISHKLTKDDGDDGSKTNHIITVIIFSTIAAIIIITFSSFFIKLARTNLQNPY